MNYFLSIKTGLTNLVLELIIQKNFYSQTSLVSEANSCKRILNLHAFMNRV